MTQPFIPRAVKLRYHEGDRAFVIEGAAASLDPAPREGAPLGVLVWNMTLLYLPPDWRIHSVPEGVARYAVGDGEGPVVRGQDDGAGPSVLVLVPATVEGQEAIARGTRFVYMRDLVLFVEDDAEVSVRRDAASTGVFIATTPSGTETVAGFVLRDDGVELTCADMTTTRVLPLPGARDDVALLDAFHRWVRAFGE